MAINIQHTYSTNVRIYYYDDEEGYILNANDCGSMDAISERVCEVLIKHNFSRADVCSAETLEALIIIERS